MSRPRIVVLRHHRRVPLSALAPELERSADLTYICGFRDPVRGARRAADLERTAAYSGIVALGGPMGVYERETYPYLDDSLSLLTHAVQSGRPVLGLCLGAQLVAEALGGRAFLGTEADLPRELGFLPFYPTAEGADDPMLAPFRAEGSGAGGYGPTLFWHQDTVSLPAGATVLAATDLYPVAAFRWGEHVYGLQFHPETTAETLRVWTAETAAMLQSHGVSGSDLVREAEERDQDIRRMADGLVRAFLGLFR